MDGLAHDSSEMGRFLLHGCLSLTNHGCLSKLIRACRPNWSEQCVWTAADTLLQKGMRPRQSGEPMQAFIEYIEHQLTLLAAQHAPQQPVPVAGEEELKAWSARWSRCRHQG